MAQLRGVLAVNDAMKAFASKAHQKDCLKWRFQVDPA